MTTVSFPGIGIGEFTMNEVALAFRLFGIDVEIRWYGILITIGIVLAILYAAKRSRDEGIILDDLLDIGIFSIISGIIGARIYYVLTYGVSNYIVRDGFGEGAKVNVWKTFVNIIAVWNGGIAIYGAIIAGALAVYLVCRHKKINCLKAYDAIGPAVMIGQILGRWGNFVNGEAYGYQVKEGSLLYILRMGVLPNVESATKIYYFHPTFLYESVWNLMGFLIINSLYKKKKFDGQVFLMYLTWYGFGRMFIEGLRTDSLYIGVFRISQVIGFCCFIIGSTLIYLGLLKAKKSALEGADYTPVYPKFSRKNIMPSDMPEDDVKLTATENTEESDGKVDTENEKNKPEGGGGDNSNASGDKGND